MITNEERFVEGFNCGYLLAAYEPNLLFVLLKNIQSNNSYILGITYGQKEYEIRQTERQLHELKNLRAISREERDLNKD